MRLTRWIVGSVIFLSLVIAAVSLFSGQILWGLGDLLVVSEAPQKADMAIVLGGDATGSRILKACELLRAGYAPHVMVSGQGSYYGTHESVLAIDLAVNRGCPREAFIPFKYPATSTFDEALHAIPELQGLGVHRLLVVTSPSHTARARRVFRRSAPGIEIHCVASNDPRWNGGYWWKTREGRKAWLLETVKTVADFIGL